MLFGAVASLHRFSLTIRSLHHHNLPIFVACILTIMILVLDETWALIRLACMQYILIYGVDHAKERFAVCGRKGHPSSTVGLSTTRCSIPNKQVLVLKLYEMQASYLGRYLQTSVAERPVNLKLWSILDRLRSTFSTEEMSTVVVVVQQSRAEQSKTTIAATLDTCSSPHSSMLLRS